MSNQHYSLPQGDIHNSLKLMNVGSAVYTGDWLSIPHTHSYAELFYVAGGAGHIQVDHDRYPITAGQLVVINPNVSHTEISHSDHPLEYIVLGIEGLELADDGQEVRFRILQPQDIDSIRTCLRNILRETQEQLPGSATVCQAYTEILVTRLMRNTELTLRDDPLSSSNNQCAAVRRYIDAHFKEPLTLDLLAQVAHVNKYYLAHSFKAEFGVSPINYQLDLRVAEGCFLLEQTDLSLAQIARALGFSSSSYFSQVFRKSKHMSPTEYRKRTAK